MQNITGTPELAPSILSAVLRIHEILVMDPDPRIHTADYWFRMRIRILLFSPVTFKKSTKKIFCLLLF
jgi:hypothetical protein